jgi:hypothetical protein
VLEEVEHRVPRQETEGGRFTEEGEAFRDQLEEGEGEEEPGAQGEQILLDLPGPFLAEADEDPAEDLGGRGDEAEEDGGDQEALTICRRECP